MAVFKVMKTKWVEVLIIVMALGLLSFCFAAWDNDRPSDSDSVYTWDNLIRANNTALEVELGIDLNEAHPYYQSAAPTLKPDVSTALDVDDNGRLWIDSDDKIVYILTDYSGPTWTKINPVLANNTYLTSVDNAGTGTVDLIKANASDVAVLPDGSEMASSGAPTADADIANKKYVDDQIVSNTALSDYTNEDSLTDAMIGSHAYLAMTDGFVSAMCELDDGEYLKGYVGNTINPAGVGTLIQDSKGGSTDDEHSIYFAVPSGKYFEIIETGDADATILWISLGTLSKPVDQD